MRSSMKASYLARAAVLVAVAVALSGCSWLRSAAGVSKAPPDEFAVLTKGSLVMPPDFGLMPPKPGAAPTNQSDPTNSAQGALFGADATAAAAAMPGTASPGEKLLLAQAGVAGADPQIRQHIKADIEGELAADDSFVNDVMFWQEKKKPEAGNPVDADAEAKRIAGQRDAGKAAGTSPEGKAAPEPKKEESKGWFDWF